MQKNSRRRINTEEKAKVVPVIWGTELIQFIAALAILHQDDLKKGINSAFSSYRPGAIYAILHIVLLQNGKEMILPPKQQ